MNFLTKWENEGNIRRRIIPTSHSRLRSTTRDSTRPHTIYLPHKWPTRRSQLIIISTTLCRWLLVVPWNQQPKRPQQTTKRPWKSGKMGRKLGHEIQCHKMLYYVNKEKDPKMLSTYQHGSIRTSRLKSISWTPNISRPQMEYTHIEHHKEGQLNHRLPRTKFTTLSEGMQEKRLHLIS